MNGAGNGRTPTCSEQFFSSLPASSGYFRTVLVHLAIHGQANGGWLETNRKLTLEARRTQGSRPAPKKLENAAGRGCAGCVWWLCPGLADTKCARGENCKPPPRIPWCCPPPLSPLVPTLTTVTATDTATCCTAAAAAIAISFPSPSLWFPVSLPHAVHHAPRSTPKTLKEPPSGDPRKKINFFWCCRKPKVPDLSFLLPTCLSFPFAYYRKGIKLREWKTN